LHLGLCCICFVGIKLDWSHDRACYVLQAARTLTRFTENAFNDALKAVMLGRSEEDIKILGNNTLMLNYHTHAWNKTIQGKQAVQSGMLL